MSKIKLRENLMRLVFEYNAVKNEELNLDVLDEEDLTEEEIKQLEESFAGIKDNYENIVKIIEDNLVKYTLNRVCKTDLAILMVAIYEIKYLNEPYKIVINEAVELAKKYSLDNSYKFVNGLLAKVVDAV